MASLKTLVLVMALVAFLAGSVIAHDEHHHPQHHHIHHAPSSAPANSPGPAPSPGKKVLAPPPANSPKSFDEPPAPSPVKNAAIGASISGPFALFGLILTGFMNL